MPPWDLVREALLKCVLAPLAISAIIFLAATLIPQRRSVVIGGVLAIVSGFLAGNYFREAEAVVVRIDSEKPFEFRDMADAAYRTAMGIKKEDALTANSLYWLPWVALLAGVAGLIRQPKAVAWPLRLIVAILATRLIVSPRQREDIAWLWPAFAATVLITSLTIESLGKTDPGGWLPLGIGVTFFAASAVLIHAHSARLTDIATIIGACWLGIAAVSFLRRSDAGSATGIAAVMLPGLLLIGQDTTYSDVPLKSFLLAGLAPLGLVPVVLLRVLGRKSPWHLFAGLVLMLIADAVAVGLAAQAESIDVN